MSLRSRLSRFLIGNDEPDREEILPNLRRFYTETVNRSRQMSHHAEISPNEASRLRLEQLAREEMEHAKRLQMLIRELGSFAGDVPPGPEPEGAINHWARLVQDLESHRTAAKEYLDWAARLTEEQPAIANFFDELARDEQIHGTALRALIARTDPQAFD